MARPNLDRIPATVDVLGRATIARAPASIDRPFLDSLTDEEVRAVGCFGLRAATFALRSGDATLLGDALFGLVLAEAARNGDWRDLMVGMAVHFCVARRIGAEPPVLFGAVADRFEGTSLAGLVRTFGNRSDVTLGAFGWRLVETPDGPDVSLP